MRNEKQLTYEFRNVKNLHDELLLLQMVKPF